MEGRSERKRRGDGNDVLGERKKKTQMPQLGIEPANPTEALPQVYQDRKRHLASLLDKLFYNFTKFWWSLNFDNFGGQQVYQLNTSEFKNKTAREYERSCQCTRTPEF